MDFEGNLLDQDPTSVFFFFLVTVVIIFLGLGLSFHSFFSCLTGGYVKLPDVFKLGIVMALVNILIWAVVATPWWKILGLY